MNQQDDIKQLVNRFFEGDTTLAEEHQLYEYFRTHEVSEERKPLQQMFLDMEAVSVPKTKATVKPLYHWHRSLMAAAAIFIGLIVVSIWFSHRQNTCVAYIYGRKVTDRAVVMHEVRNTMGIVTEGNPGVDHELKGLFE
jgi:hypothetical protein